MGKAIGAIVAIIFMPYLSSCSSGDMEASTSAPVNVYKNPEFPKAPGNEKVGIIPANKTVAVKREMVVKELMVYEVEYTSSDGDRIKGYVPLGTEGFEVRQARE